MKKLMIFLLFLCLVGCGDSYVHFEDVEVAFKATQSNSKENANASTEVKKQDYLTLIEEIEEMAKQTNYGIKEEDSSNLYMNLYATAYELEYLGQRSECNYSDINKLSSLALKLVEACYDNEEEVESLKTQIEELSSELKQKDDTYWKDLEITQYLSYNNVSKQYDFLDENYMNDMIEETVVETDDLIELRNIIIDNIALIEEGVSEDTHSLAKQMYLAACKLERYTRYIYSDNADKVFYFAKYTKDYIKTRYTDYTSELEYNYEEELSGAKKYTQSVFNEICILLRQ